MVWPLSPFAPAIPLAVLHMRDRWWFPPRGVDVEGWIRACREVAPEEAGAMDSDLAQYRRGGRPLPVPAVPDKPPQFEWACRDPFPPAAPPSQWGPRPFTDRMRRTVKPPPPGASGSLRWSRDYRDEADDFRPSEPIPTTR